MEKFNIDGAIEGGFRRAKIRGNLRNFGNEILLLFSLSVGLFDASLTELLAIQEALFLFSGSIWSNTFSLLLECDCSLCVEWLCRPNVAPPIFKNIIDGCLNFSSGISWSIQFAVREANGTTDKLAKRGCVLDFVILGLSFIVALCYVL
ncbi:hypothetical protein GQ457_05G026650 [Hibiscus cannabinus]